MYKLLDVFSGCGGMTLGFTDPRFCGRFRSVFAVDHDNAAVGSYSSNFGNHAVCGDIDEWVSGKHEIPRADIVIGGPPCQGFSLLNKSRNDDARRALWQPYMDIVAMSGASAFIIENVQGLLGSPEHYQIVQRAKELGFSTTAALLNAADYGVPQTRVRTFIFGWQERLAPAAVFPPRPTHAQRLNGSGLPIWKTVRDAISDLPAPVGTEIRDVQPPLNLHFGRTPTQKSLMRYRAVPPGGNRFDLQKNAPELTPECWIRKVDGGTDLFGRLWWDRPSVTIRTEFFKPEKGRYLHPDQHRPITHREAARLMGFPDDFQFTGSKVEIARQIGNAVPPPLAGAVARHVGSLLDEWFGVSAFSMPHITATEDDIMLCKKGSGWKACFDGNNGRYFGEYGGIQEYHLYEITKEIFDRLDKKMTESDAGSIMHEGRHMYMAVNDRCGPPYTIIFDDDYEKLCPWAGVVKSGKVWPDELTDAVVEVFESERNNREQRRKKRELKNSEQFHCSNVQPHS